MLTLQGLKRAFVIKALAVVLPCASAGLTLYATFARQVADLTTGGDR